MKQYILTYIQDEHVYAEIVENDTIFKAVQAWEDDYRNEYSTLLKVEEVR